MTKTARILVGPAPHIHDSQSTASLVWGCVLALVPALLWGVYCFGVGAALVVAAALGGALAGEGLAGLARRRFSLLDGSAFLTGLLVGLAMPPGAPLYVPAASAFFATAFVKGAFGGLGSNWMNPALAGIAFAVLNWPQAMGAWVLPRHLTGVVGISGATPLALVRDKLASGQGGSDPLAILEAAGQSFTGLDRGVTGFLNGGLFERLGASLPQGYIDLLVGNRPGAVGELSGLLLLAASVVLVARRMIRWEVPLSIFASYAALVWAFGGLPFGEGFFSGDVLFEVLSGSFLLVSFFMATDPVTSPSTRLGMAVYGAGVGALTFLLRSFGSRPEGTAFAVILMNCALPLLERLERPRRGEAAK